MNFKQETQNAKELDAFLDFIRRNEINLYMEIGLYAGATFKRVYEVLKESGKPFTMIGVDLPANPNAFAECQKVVNGLEEESVVYSDPRCEVLTFYKSSTDPHTVEEVTTLVNGIEDARSLVFIDGDHSYAQARDDYQAYSGLFEFVAFNDVSMRTVAKQIQKHGRDVATVAHLYNALRLAPGLEEWYTEDPEAPNPRGIGVLY